MFLPPCLILGDSHADGTAAAVRAAMGDRCAVVARNGIGSAAILRRTPQAMFATAIVSAGANDPANPALPRNLHAIRERLRAGRVLWLLPYDRRAAAAVAQVAARWGDLVIDLRWARSRADGVHCQSYRWVARSVTRAGYLGTAIPS